jgi:formylglycine-generating enzyme
MTLVGVKACHRVDAFADTKGPPVQDLALTALGGSPTVLAAIADVPVEDLLPEGDRPLPMNGLCPPDMASVDDRFCVDKFEASLLEVLPNGEERAWPYYLPVEGHVVRAVSERGVYPQGYISGKQAGEACKRSGKRLCKTAEWRTACRGPEQTRYPYGNDRRSGTCNDHGRSGMGVLFGTEIAQGKGFVWQNMNHPDLNQLPGTLAETGSHAGCTNGYGVYDMVGNLHEWVDDPSGAFQGGYYLDVQQLGEGCGYRADAHEFGYHDYSTGFRCCADVAP